MIKWHIEVRKITDLKEWTKNPRLLTEKGIADLTESISKFGLAEPIVTNTDGTILGGHARVKVLKTQGETECDCYVPDRLLTEKEIEEINIRLNANTAGIWDTERLANEWELKELLDWGLDIAGFGQPEATEDDFEIPEAIETDIVAGDLFEIGTHRLLCGDSTSETDVHKLLDGNCPILCVTDPPYGVNYDPDWRNHALRSDGIRSNGRAIGTVTNDYQIDWSKAFELFKGNVIYCWHSDRYAKQVHEHLEASGFDIVAQLIWAKNGHVIGRGDYHFQHEPCWYAVRKKQKHNWQGSRSETSLWEIPRNQKNETGHSTQKPIECMARPIRNNSAEGESVYDPFLGSGTTMVAAQQLNRKCFGMEIDEKYCAVILQRMKKSFPELEIKRNGEIYAENKGLAKELC